MRAKLVLDQDCDLSKRLEHHPPVAWRKEKNGNLTPYYPKGSEFAGEQAVALCKRGQAAPADDECAQAVGYTESQMASVQINYKMDSLGINDKDDRDLYRAGVILGYKPDKSYIPGPNWDAYQAALAEVDEEEDI